MATSARDVISLENHKSKFRFLCHTEDKSATNLNICPCPLCQKVMGMKEMGPHGHTVPQNRKEVSVRSQSRAAGGLIPRQKI